MVQDVLLFNLIQAIQNAVDAAVHVLSEEGWGIPGTQSETFELLRDQGVLPPDLTQQLIAMVGFRNRVVHEYEDLDWERVYKIWQQDLGVLDRFREILWERYGP